MALVTSILTGGSNNHETTSEEANAVYTDFVSEGIVGTVGNTSGVAPATGGFAVNAQGTPDMTVEVGTGVAYVTGTPTSQNSQTFRVKNSAAEDVTISANSSGSTKYDWLYLKLDATNLNTPNTAGDNVATLVTSRSSSAASDDGTPPTYGYPLAVITVANGATSITNSNIRDVRSQVALNTGTSNAVDGWTALSGTPSVSTGYNKGNKEFDITFASSMASILSPGMRLKFTRATTPPTQCTDLESGSSQYANRASASLTGITFTDDFTCEAWVKLESYAGSISTIISRGTSTNGWFFDTDSSGRLRIYGMNSSTYEGYLTYQSLPLGKWVHVAGALDLSGSSAALYINGVSVPNTAISGGGALNTITQSGLLELGASAGGTTLFDGKIADARVWSDIRTATEIRDNMNQQLVGNESNLVAYYKLDGDFNDSTSNGNNLTAQGSAAATNSDNPMNATEYAIVTKVATTTVTVFTGTDYNIPNMTLSTPYYSTQKAPFGFPSGNSKWYVQTIIKTSTATASPTQNVWYNMTNASLSVPTGAWQLGYKCSIGVTAPGGGAGSPYITLSSANNTESDPNYTQGGYTVVASNPHITPAGVKLPLDISAATPYYLNAKTDLGSAANLDLYASSRGPAIITAECAYV